MVLPQFTEYGTEGVVPLELLPSDVRSKYQAKPSDRSKRAKKDETRGAAQAEENQVSSPVLTFSNLLSCKTPHNKKAKEKYCQDWQYIGFIDGNIEMTEGPLLVI